MPDCMQQSFEHALVLEDIGPLLQWWQNYELHHFFMDGAMLPYTNDAMLAMQHLHFAVAFTVKRLL